MKLAASLVALSLALSPATALAASRSQHVQPPRPQPSVTAGETAVAVGVTAIVLCALFCSDDSEAGFEPDPTKSGRDANGNLRCLPNDWQSVPGCMTVFRLERGY